eukprot:4110592-Prymnesium_polylepis.1
MVGRAVAALDDLDEALALRPGWGRALHRRAFVRKELRDFDGAATDFEAAAAADPELRVNCTPRETRTKTAGARAH